MMAIALALASLPQARADDPTERTVSVEGRYYQDSVDDRRYDQSLDAVIPLAHRAFTIAANSHWSTDPRGNAASQELLLGVKNEPVRSYSLTGAVGLVRFDAGVTAAGLFEAQHTSDAGQLRLRAEYTPLFDVPDMIRNEIMFAGLELYGKATLSQRVRPSADVFLRDYSDNNDSIRVRGDLPYAVLLAPVRWEFGYRQEYAAFRRRTLHVYFDPGGLNAFQAFSSVSYWTEAVHADAEVYGGVQKSTRSGSTSVDEFSGLYAEAAAKTLGSFEIGFTVDADDYALATPGGFRHVQVGLKLTKRL